MRQDPVEEFRNAVPRSEELTIRVPGETGGTSGAARAELIGERAHLYQFTRDTSRFVNGSIWVVLQLMKAITEYPPTEIDGDHAVWGPWNETLSPITYVFVVERVSEGHYHYVLSGKPRDAGDDAFVALVAGDSEIDDAAGVRRGAIGLDFDAANALDAGEHPHVGRVGARYDVGAGFVEAAFENVRSEETGELVNALYRYTEAADGSGTFAFGLRADFDDEGAAQEDLVVTSRWDTSGSGRGDVIATGGDLGELVVYASECWDRSFGRSYYGDNVDMAAAEGDAASCAYAEPLWSE
jgi:hypothetical protein